MDPEESREALQNQNELLRQENDTLKLTLSLLRENQNLRCKLYDADSSCADQGAFAPPEKVSVVTWNDTLEEGSFSPTVTSSPLEVSTHRKSAMKSPRTEQEHTHLPKVKDPERLVGEMAFQLDRRILSHVFQEQHRLYGFTVGNIPEKIIQVCTHPVSGKVDESLRVRLSQRYVELLERLGRFGYSSTRHPPLTELIVNTYGILSQRPDPLKTRDHGYGTAEALQRLVVQTVPSGLLKDTLLIHTCLCYLAAHDGKALFLW